LVISLPPQGKEKRKKKKKKKKKNSLAHTKKKEKENCLSVFLFVCLLIHSFVRSFGRKRNFAITPQSLVGIVYGWDYDGI